MSRFETFIGYVGADQSCLEAWNLPDIETGITMIHHTIGDHVLGRSTCGVVFAEETEQGKLRHLRIMQAHQINGYDGLGRRNYLWTLIERDGGLYKAKFLTADAVDQLTDDDIIPMEPKPVEEEVKNNKLLVLGLVAILLIIWSWYHV